MPQLVDYLRREYQDNRMAGEDLVHVGIASSAASKELATAS